MDALLIRVCLLVATFCSLGASYRSPNFQVEAPTQEMAKKTAEMAEYYRVEIAKSWLGKTLPKWSKPCKVKVTPGPNLGAGGATTFVIDRGEVFGWNMNIQGTWERILDSVLPHEVSHTIFASHFRRPLPRWADEGAATLVEHDSETRRQRLLTEEVMRKGTAYRLRDLLAIKEYPRRSGDVMKLYAQGYSLADYLVLRNGKTTFLKFLEDAHHKGWDYAVQTNYRWKNVESMEHQWKGWMMAGSPRVLVKPGEALASSDQNNTGNRSSTTIRGQNPNRQRAVPQSQNLVASTGRSSTRTSQIEAPRVRSSQDQQLADASNARFDRSNLTQPVFRVSNPVVNRMKTSNTTETQQWRKTAEISPFERSGNSSSGFRN